MPKMKVGMISLGCDKNRVDSEKMLYLIKNAGFTVTEVADDADVMIINTCAFIDAAKKETIDAIFDTAELKKNNLKKIIVTGCFAERYGKDVDFPEVDLFLDIKNEGKIVDILNGFEEKPTPMCQTSPLDFTRGRVLTTPAHYAYLKIADGCDNRCSYCAIPYIRGRYRSRAIEELYKEAELLAAEGVKELILVAQDTTNYGKDIYGKPSLVELLTELVKLPFWKIRILYAYPELIDDRLLSFIAASPKIAKYLDVPLQHADDGLLKKMNRRGSNYGALIERIRESVPDISLRSSFICGFPYETEKEHEVLLNFLSNGVDYGGFFAYSPEEGTPSESWKPRANARTVKKWISECEDAQTKFTIKRQARFKGKTLQVIYEGIDYGRQLFYGRSEYSAPDIDTYVYFGADFPLEVGKIYDVNITETDFNLYGKAVKESE